MNVSVVIPTRNRGSLIGPTLRALLRLEPGPTEILIIDQSTDEVTKETVAEVAGTDGRVKYETSGTVGCSAGRNVGAELARSEVVAYADDDCIVTDEWLPAIEAEFRDAGVAAVFGRLLPFERVQRTGTEVGLKDTPGRQEFTHKTPPWYVGHGGNMAVRRRDLIDVGGFDPLLGAGAPLRSNEDGDLTYRLLASGKRVVYSPAALAYHRHWKDWRAQRAMERAYGIGAGAQFAKYVRCRDLYGVRLLATWIWQLGVRRVGAGLLKWRSRKVVYLGICQLVCPWFGIWQARRYPVDRRSITYVTDRSDRYFSLVPRATT